MNWRLKHGDSSKELGVPEYRVWAQMKDRCHNPACKSYPRYGGRGISVCQRWRDDYRNFLADMGRRPSRKHSIDRINNDGNYEPGNCRWATSTEQMRNRRGTRLNSEAVKVIRFMSEKKGTDPALLALLHGVCEAAIRDVRTYKNWREPGQERKRVRKDYLNAEAVKVIRYIAATRYRSSALLARIFKVSQTAIHAIVIRKTWKMVQP